MGNSESTYWCGCNRGDESNMQELGKNEDTESDWLDSRGVMGWTRSAIVKMTRKAPYSLEHQSERPKRIIQIGTCQLFSLFNKYLVVQSCEVKQEVQVLCLDESTDSVSKNSLTKNAPDEEVKMKILTFLEVPYKMQVAIEHEQDMVIGTENGYICNFSVGDFLPLAKSKVTHSVFSLCSWDSMNLLVGQDEGHLSVISTFGSELSVQNHLNAHFPQMKAIQQIQLTSQDDLCVATSGGFYLMEFSPSQGFSVKFQVQETRHNNLTKCFEFFPGQFILGFHECPELQLIDRSYSEGEPNLFKSDQFDGSQCTSLVPLPGFDLEVFPFFVAQNKSGLFLVNLKDKKVTDLGPTIVKANQFGGSTSFRLTNTVGCFQRNDEILLFYTDQSPTNGKIYLYKIPFKKNIIDVQSLL